MELVFLISAAVGVTVLLVQFALTLMGLGGHGVDVDAPHDFGAGAGHDFGGDVHGDTSGGDHGDGDASHDTAHEAPSVTHHDATWLFQVISFRTLVAALALFGLAGLAMRAAGFSPAIVLLVAVAAGVAAMYGVYWLMRLLYTIRAEGTAHIQRALGLPATVYLTIPGERTGTGKIQINLQNRTMEYLARTSGPAIATGTKVEVVDILTGDTVEVWPLESIERDSHA